MPSVARPFCHGSCQRPGALALLAAACTGAVALERTTPSLRGGAEASTSFTRRDGAEGLPSQRWARGAEQSGHASTKDESHPPWHDFIARYENQTRSQSNRRLTNIPKNTGKRNSLGYILAGYDVFKGNPSPTRGSIDPGFQHEIFVADYSAQKSTPDGRYAVPKGVSTLPCDGACSMKSRTTSIAGTHSYAEDLSTKVSFDVSGFGARFGASFNYQEVEVGASAHSEVYSMCQLECCSYEAQLDSFSPPTLTDNFLAAVFDFLPVVYEQTKYFQVLSEFGTHYVSMAAMGGVYGQQSTFTRSSWQSMVSSSFDWDVYAQASLVVSFSLNTAMSTLRNESKTFQQFASNIEIYSLGQKPPASGNPDDWFQSALQAPAPIHLNLLPITDLFEQRFYQGLQGPNGAPLNLTTLPAKQTNMQQALAEYCPQLLQAQGLLKSCAAPTPDTPAPGPETTCLGKVVGGGGNDGILFDDGVSLIELHGLFHNLDVKQIQYATGPDSLGLYVGEIQLALRLGDNTWPLKNHGHWDNHPDIGDVMRIDEGTKVVAAQVRSCSYVNSITFYTSNGISQGFGGSGGCNTTMINFKEEVLRQRGFSPSSAWLVGLFGRSDKWINQIGFYFAYTIPTGESCGPNSTTSSGADA